MTLAAVDWILPDGVIPTNVQPEAVLLGAVAYEAVRVLAEKLGMPLNAVSRWPGVPILRGRDGRVPSFACVRIWGLEGRARGPRHASVL